MHCPTYLRTQEQQEHREELTSNLDFTLSSMEPHGLHPTHPWSALPEEIQINTLLGAAPPQTWRLNKDNQLNWIRYIEKDITSWIKPIINDASEWRNTTIPTLG